MISHIRALPFFDRRLLVVVEKGRFKKRRLEESRKRAELSEKAGIRANTKMSGKCRESSNATSGMKSETLVILVIMKGRMECALLISVASNAIETIDN